MAQRRKPYATASLRHSVTASIESVDFPPRAVELNLPLCT